MPFLIFVVCLFCNYRDFLLMHQIKLIFIFEYGCKFLTFYYLGFLIKLNILYIYGMDIGVYKLSWPSGHCYIGKSWYMSKRFRRHVYLMKANKHPNTLMNELYKAFGPPVFTILRQHASGMEDGWERKAEKEEIGIAISLYGSLVINRYDRIAFTPEFLRQYLNQNNLSRTI